MEDFPDHYSALGVDPTADQDVIAAAFRALAKKYHPDTGTAAGTASPERFAEVQEAYEVLGNPERRVEYDADLLEATQRALDAHLAAKTRRLAPGSVAQERLGKASPDLGGVRPDAAVRATSRGRRGFAIWLFVAILLVSAAGATTLWTRTPPPAVPAPAELAVQEPAPTPPVADKVEEAQQEPVFGSSATPGAQAPEQVEASVPGEPEAAIPTPKAKPAVPPAAPKPAPAVQQMPKPAPADRGLFALVILEKSGAKPATSEQASVLFTTRSNCVEFGVKTVLRRLAAEKGPAKPRIWYECRDAEG